MLPGELAADELAADEPAADEPAMAGLLGLGGQVTPAPHESAGERGEKDGVRVGETYHYQQHAATSAFSSEKVRLCYIISHTQPLDTFHITYFITYNMYVPCKCM